MGKILPVGMLYSEKGLLRTFDRRNGSESTPTLQKPKGFRVKAPEGEVVVFYFKPSATQNLKFSGFPAG
jgi:hypothetical protein